MKKREISLLLALVLALGLLPPAAFAAEEPTASYSATEFKNMKPNGKYILKQDITVKEPYASDFFGTFDGAGHTITLEITASSPNTGLFSKVGEDGTVKNVITAGSVKGTNQVGGIAGYYNAFLSNCEVYGDVICETKGAFAGGLTGWVSTCKLTYTGGKMAGNVTAVDGAYVGIVLGGQNKAAGTLGAHTLGTADAPIVISSKATINGVAVTAADAADKAKICGKLEDEAKLTVNTVFEE